MPNNEESHNVYRILKHIEDMSEAIDQHTKALITINDRIESIAKHLHIKLNPPLVNMDMERGNLSACNIIDAEIEIQKIERY